MSTTSTNFSLILATTSDVVSVTSHIANNFSTLDSIIGVSHTGTGQLKSGLTFTNPTIISPIFSGTATGGNIFATTGHFQTITATGGALTINTLNIGTYALPSTIGASGQLLTVITGNAVFVSPSGGTGASTALDNLASVAINTSLGTFTAGFVTVNRVIATSGALTGLTVFQASTGTFAGALLVSSNVTISGTATINVVNATGGTITAGAFSIGTYSYPATVGAAGQYLRVVTANAVWTTDTGAMELVSSATFSGSAQVNIALTLRTGAMYSISIEGKASGGDAVPFVRVNSDNASSYTIYAPGNLAPSAATAMSLAVSASNAAYPITTDGSYYTIRGEMYERDAKVFFRYDTKILNAGAGTGTSGLMAYYTGTGTGINLVESAGNGYLTGIYRIYKMKTS